MNLIARWVSREVRTLTIRLNAKSAELYAVSRRVRELEDDVARAAARSEMLADQLADRDSTIRELVDRHTEQHRVWAAAFDASLIPAPPVVGPSQDRPNAVRLAGRNAELRHENEDLRRANARLAVRVAELETKYEGNPA